MRSTSTSHFSRGFTVVELMIVIAVSAILAVILFGPLDDLYRSNTKSISKVVQVADARTSLRSVQNTITLSNGFLDQNIVADPDPDKTWLATNDGANNVLITSNHATTENAASDTNNDRQLVLRASCNQPVNNNYIYFVEDETLYRRTLTETLPSGSTCNNLTIGQLRTCTADYQTKPYKDNCQGVDAKILAGVTNFTVEYYNDPADSTPVSDPTTASTVVLKVSTKKGTGNNETTTSTSLRVTRIN